MASIVKRNNRYYVVYLYTDEKTGKRKQKWEAAKSLDTAKKRRAEVEYRKEVGTLVVQQCNTLEELLTEYVELYGRNTWSISMYTSTIRLIDNYVIPHIGKMKLKDITPRVLEKYYLDLLKEKAATKCTDRKGAQPIKTITPNMVKRIHTVLKSCFHQAMKWELMEKNPATLATIPKTVSKKREIWDAKTLVHALEICEDPMLKLAINLAFSCTLRMGEMLGLTWDCIDISEESRILGRSSLYINKELQRVNKEALKFMEQKDVLLVFPEQTNHNKTVMVLKKPKTDSSIRRVYIPKSVSEMLRDWKQKQDEQRELLGDEYDDYQLVFAGSFGLPTESSHINNLFHRLIKENDLPKVVFHSLRHSSITYKLKLTGGDVKSVQGDSGHAQAKMVTDQYSHILDDERVKNAEIFEEVFYSGRNEKKKKSDNNDTSGGEAAMIAKLLSNPETASLLKKLVKAMDENGNN